MFGPVKRESGGRPERSRRCDRGAAFPFFCPYMIYIQCKLNIRKKSCHWKIAVSVVKTRAAGFREGEMQ